MTSSNNFIVFSRFTFSRYLLASLFLLVFIHGARPQRTANDAAEKGKFRLHKFAQAIGEESYSIEPSAGSITLSSRFLFTDRGTQVPLDAKFTAAADYRPQSFTLRGQTCRFCPIDWDIRIENGNAKVRLEKQTKDAPIPASFFTTAGYAPVAMQMAMMRYWKLHGSPSSLAIVPTGQVQISDRGAENFTVDGRIIHLRRFTVRGLIWGMETLWMEGENLAALVSTDAEFDHFEAVREEYEPLLSKFIASAASDEMSAITELTKKVSASNSGTLAFQGATLIDGTGRPPVANATVVTRGGKIVAAGPAGEVKVPADARRIDVSGKFVIPGLWDMHAHYEQVEWGPIYLAAGITTVRDVGNEFDFITAVRDALNSGKALGPHMLMAGVVDGDGPLALGVTRVNSAADAKTWVQRYHDAGFQQIKIYSSMKTDNVKAVCAEAHRLGMTVTGHIPEGMNGYQGIEDGMDQVNHISYIYDLLIPENVDRSRLGRLDRLKLRASVDLNSPEEKKAVQFLKDHKTVIDDTMAIMEMEMRPADADFAKLEPGVNRVAPELREQLVNGGAPPQIAPFMETIRGKYLQLIGILHREGIPMIAGTDQTVPGFSLYREIELYVDAGFTPMEALQAATLVPARAMKLDSESGTVEAGKRADFDVLDSNPLENIRNIRSVRSVVSNGVLYNSAPLWESVGFKP
jgi:imidazolonepropionase-like amidohydrolase